jgi:hypothetical protein
VGGVGVGVISVFIMANIQNGVLTRETKVMANTQNERG